MGFTPLEGLMMGSRFGTISPGILIHLLREEGYSADRLEALPTRRFRHPRGCGGGARGLGDCAGMLEACTSGMSFGFLMDETQMILRVHPQLSEVRRVRHCSRPPCPRTCDVLPALRRGVPGTRS